MGGSNEALKLDIKRAIKMGTRLDLKLHERREGAIKHRRHVFVPKVGTEDCMMKFLARFVGEKK